MIFHRLRSYLFALLIAGAGLAGTVPAPSVDAATGSPPACTYENVPATHQAYSDWDITLVDTIYSVPKDYVPPGLVSTAQAGLGGGEVRKLVIPDLTAMADAARMADAGLRIVSAYRSYATQQALYQNEIAKHGKALGRKSVARPGHSEHQLGVTIDFGSSEIGDHVSQKFANTPAGKWMLKNAWKFGFILSYPYGKTKEVCYLYEPWHYRYVGRETAAKVHASGLTLREYLWKHDM